MFHPPGVVSGFKDFTIRRINMTARREVQEIGVEHPHPLFRIAPGSVAEWEAAQPIKLVKRTRKRARRSSQPIVFDNHT